MTQTERDHLLTEVRRVLLGTPAPASLVEACQRIEDLLVVTEEPEEIAAEPAEPAEPAEEPPPMPHAHRRNS